MRDVFPEDFYIGSNFELFESDDMNYDDDSNSSPSRLTPAGSQSPTKDVAKAKKKRRRRSRRVLPPRVFKCDIRRTYANMFCNVINNGEVEHITRFFQRFARPTTSMVYNCNGADFKTPTSFLVPGIHNLNAYFTRLLIPFPDLVFRLKTAHIYTKLNAKDSKIEFTVDVRATELFEMPVNLWMPFIKPLMNGKVVGSAIVAGSSEDASVCEYIDFMNFENTTSGMPTIPPPQVPAAIEQRQLHFDAKLSFHLDERNQIRLFDFRNSVVH